MNADEARELMDLTQKIAAAKGFQRDRDARIASLIRYKRASVTEVVAATGLTKARIYQIVEKTK